MSNATKEDLLELEVKLAESSKTCRHGLRGEIQKYTLDLEEYKQDQALIKQSQKTMQDNIKEIKKDIKDLGKTIESSFKALPEHFPTREEHNNIKERIKFFERWLWFIMTTIGIAIIGSILKLILL